MKHSPAYINLMNQIQEVISTPPKPDDSFHTLILNLFDESDQEEIEVEFTQDQERILNNYGIINNRYYFDTCTEKSKRKISRSDLMEFLSILLAIIAIINGFLSGEEQKKQTELMRQEIVELRETQKIMKETIDMLQHSATSDEATE